MIASPAILILAKPYDAQLMRRYAEAAGSEATVVTAVDAVDSVSGVAPDVIIVSYKLVGADSTALVAALHRQQLRSVPLILLVTPMDPVASVAQARQWGADYLLRAPVSASAFGEKVEAALFASGGGTCAGRTPPRRRARAFRRRWH